MRFSRLFLVPLLAGALACGSGDGTLSPTAPTPGAAPAAGTAISYAALGASDALGIGGTSPCPPFSPCESGTGYVQRLTRELRAEPRDVSLVNLGIPAAVLSPAVYQLARSNGREVPANFVDHELPFLPAGATLVTIFGGANDANAVGDAMRRGAAGSDIKGFVDAQVRAFGADYDRLVNGVRNRAPDAFIIVVNVPNLAGLPYASGFTLQERQVLQALSVGFTREANRQAGRRGAVLDLMCDTSAYDPSRISPDGFHPNDAGYAYLAQRLRTIISGASATASSSCGQMTLVPAL